MAAFPNEGLGWSPPPPPPGRVSLPYRKPAPSDPIFSCLSDYSLDAALFQINWRPPWYSG